MQIFSSEYFYCEVCPLSNENSNHISNIFYLFQDVVSELSLPFYQRHWLVYLNNFKVLFLQLNTICDKHHLISLIHAKAQILTFHKIQ